MLLTFDNSDPFATGVTDYFYLPTSRDIDSRIIIQIEIEGVLASAIVDTGAPYVVCSPDIAKAIGIQHDSSRESIELVIRRFKIKGQLKRLNLTFIASEGQSLDVSATVFVPDESAQESIGDLPSFIGLTGCLERMRFAVDPNEDRFYFGPLSDDFL
jgi:hypothetical protein